MESIERLKNDWLLRVSRKAHAHALAAARARALHNWIGIPSIVLSTLVGTAVFSEITRGSDGFAKWIVTILVLIAAGLSALQTFLRFAEHEVLHNDCRRQFSKLRRDIEIALLATNPEEQRSLMLRIQSQINEIAEPHIPNSIWKRVLVLYPTPPSVTTANPSLQGTLRDEAAHRP